MQTKVFERLVKENLCFLVQADFEVIVTARQTNRRLQ